MMVHIAHVFLSPKTFTTPDPAAILGSHLGYGRLISSVAVLWRATYVESVSGQIKKILITKTFSST